MHYVCTCLCAFASLRCVRMFSHTWMCVFVCRCRPQARLHLAAINCMRLLRPPPFVYCRLLFQGPPALDKLQTFDGLVAEHSNNMLRSSANYSTLKCGCIGKECEHVYCVDNPERFAAEGRKDGKESLKMIKEVGQSNLLSSWWNTFGGAPVNALRGESVILPWWQYNFEACK